VTRFFSGTAERIWRARDGVRVSVSGRVFVRGAPIRIGERVSVLFSGSPVPESWRRRLGISYETTPYFEDAEGVAFDEETISELERELS